MSYKQLNVSQLYIFRSQSNFCYIEDLTMTEKENKVLSDKNEPSPDEGQLELFTSPHVIEGSYDMTMCKGVSVSMEYFENIKRCRNFQTRKDDVFVISFPKSGRCFTNKSFNSQVLSTLHIETI